MRGPQIKRDDKGSSSFMEVVVWQGATTGVLAWIIQRVTAVLLLVLVPLKVFSGWAFVNRGPAWLAGLHVNTLLDSVLIASVVWHALFGLRTLLLEFGFARMADKLFFVFAGVGVALSVLGVWMSIGG